MEIQHASSRRAILGGALSVATFMASGIRANAQDPTVVFQIIQTAAKLYELLKSKPKEPDLEASLGTIQQQIAGIAVNQERILFELSRLFPYIPEVVRKALTAENINDLKARQNEFNTAIGLKFRWARKSEFTALRRGTLHDTERMAVRDYTAFCSFMAGATMCLVLARAERDKDVYGQLVRQFRKDLDRWLDPQSEDSVTYAINYLTKLKIDPNLDILHRAELPANRKINLWGSWPQSHDGMACQMTEYLIIEGDFDSGYSGRSQYEYSDCKTPPPKETDGRGADRRFIIQPEGDADYAGIPTAPSPSDKYGQVTGLNKIRDDTIADMRRRAELAALERCIRFARDSMPA